MAMSISILWQKFHNLVIAHIFLSIGSLLIIFSSKSYLTSHFKLKHFKLKHFKMAIFILDFNNV